jgi:hypothetical protein
MTKAFPRTTEDLVVLEGKLYNRLVDELERQGRLSVAPPLRLTDTGAGRLLSFPRPPRGLIPIMIDNSTQDGTHWRWFYTWHKTSKVATGYFDGSGPSADPWSRTVGAVSGSSSTYSFAYNGAENISYGTGSTQTFGNGWTQPAINSLNAATSLTWSIRPITPGTVVWAEIVYPDTPGSLPEAWFSMPNVLRPGA